MLYFDIQNFRVFLNDTFLDMQANTKQTKYKENLLEVSYGSKRKILKKYYPILLYMVEMHLVRHQ